MAGKAATSTIKKIALGRLSVGTICAFMCFSLIGAKAFYLATNADLRSQFGTKTQSKIERGIITDRNGKVLATSVPVKILHADPKLILDPFETAGKLAPLCQIGQKSACLSVLPKDPLY